MEQIISGRWGREGLCNDVENDGNLTPSNTASATMLPGTPVDPETRLYAYDPIGNRRTATEGSVSTVYSSNNLNQYTSVSAASVVNPVHDDDGNVTDYKNMKYSWNAENQMISAEPKNPAEGDRKTEYLYDYMGRRARKQIYIYSSGTWALSTEKLFVYDGWNLIKEITKTGASSSDKFYVWGLDLSQSLQGAGGIGGLVCAVHAGEVRHYFYDGNGNVGQVVNADGSIAAHYEYDPFGNALVADGEYVQENPFRFSTKYYDAETGLYYYIFRYYSAEFGRWWSRDPLGEEGGINFYMFSNNNSVSQTDYLGLLCIVKSFSMTVIKWIDEWPSYWFYKESIDGDLKFGRTYTKQLRVIFTLELDNCSNKEDCEITQIRTGLAEFSGKREKADGVTDTPYWTNSWWDGYRWYAADGEWRWNMFGFLNDKATFKDEPGLRNVSIKAFPVYYGGVEKVGGYKFKTIVKDKATRKYVSVLDWELSIDYMTPRLGHHWSKPRVGETIFAK